MPKITARIVSDHGRGPVRFEICGIGESWVRDGGLRHPDAITSSRICTDKRDSASIRTDRRERKKEQRDHYIWYAYIVYLDPSGSSS
jgi:hypothetical protein